MRPFSQPRPPVSHTYYSAEALAYFAAGEHEAFLADGGRPLRVRLARALALAKIKPGQVVVDLGCGRGEAAAYAARRGARVLALDYSVSALGMAAETAKAVRERYPRMQGVEFAAGEATRLPLADGCADRVLVLDVVEHLWPWQQALLYEEVRRVMAPGGCAVVHTLPNRWALATSYRLLRMMAPGLPAGGKSDYERAVHVDEQDPWMLRRRLEAAGLACRVWVEEWSTRQAARSVARWDATRRRSQASGLRASESMGPMEPARAEGAGSEAAAANGSRGERDGGARAGAGAVRARGYPLLARPRVRQAASWLMGTPLAPLVGNDLFALAWRRPIDTQGRAG